MTKNEILEQLRAAKTAHISWVQKAKMLINGVKMEKNAIPVNSTECRFGKWFYGDAQKLNALPTNPLECMQNIESLHFKLHDIYLNIFKIYYQEDKKQGFFSKLFGKKKRITDAEQELAETYFKELEATSKALLEEINRMERRILVIPDKQLEEIV